MKNYYQILQVMPQAEPAVIEAAYRSLMRRYHPDTLTEAQRADPELLRKVQDLTEAYAVLSDPERRREYDQRQAQATAAPAPPKVGVEKRMFLVRCSLTRNTFKMLLGRRAGTTGPFRVLGLERTEVAAAQPAGPPRLGLLALIKAAFGNRPPRLTGKVAPQCPPTATGFMSEDEIQALFAESQDLNFGDIEWAGHTCPDCNGIIHNADGTHSHWTRCGSCSRMSCAGNSHQKGENEYFTCPWCKRTNKITKSVRTGDKTALPLKGNVSLPPDGPLAIAPPPPALEKPKPQLGDGKSSRP